MATPPPPQRLRRLPVEMVDDLIPEILLRIPPYKPANLVRCSAVCKPWRRILTGPAFLRRYRAFHGVPPMLGFLINVELPGRRFGARYARVSSFRPRTLDHADLSALGSRHGRVLLHAPDRVMAIFVWDPITDRRWELPRPALSLVYWVAAVLCAAAAPGSGRECDHLDCHGGHFLVAVVGTTVEGRTCACVYSSEAAAWGDATYAKEDLDDALEDMDIRPSALVGNTINFITARSKTIVEFDLGRRQLALIDPPLVSNDYAVVMPAAGGALGFAAVQGTSLHLWSREIGPDGITAWKQLRVIEFNTLRTRAPLCRPSAVVGFAEGLHAVFVQTDDGVFAIELRSGRVKKVSSRNRTSVDIIIPYMSFYTPDHATG